MADINNLLSSLGGLLEIQQGAAITAAGYDMQAGIIRQAGEIASQGAQIQATGFRQSAGAVAGATLYNSKLDSINTKRRLESVSRQYQRVLGQQLAVQARTGISVTSKSFLEVQNETMNIYDRGLMAIKLDAENTSRAKQYTSAVQQIELENQARISEFRAAAERVMSGNKAAEAAFQGEIATFGAAQKTIRAVPTLLSEAFSTY